MKHESKVGVYPFLKHIKIVKTVQLFYSGALKIKADEFF